MKTFAALALLALQAAAGNVARQGASIGSLLIHESTDCGSPVVKEIPAQLSTCIPLGGNYTNVDVSALEVSAAATCYTGLYTAHAEDCHWEAFKGYEAAPGEPCVDYPLDYPLAAVQISCFE